MTVKQPLNNHYLQNPEFHQTDNALSDAVQISVYVELPVELQYTNENNENGPNENLVLAYQ